VPLTIGGCLPAVAVAEAGTSAPGPFRMRSVVVSPVAEAGTSTPSPFRMRSVVPPIAEAVALTPSPFRMWSVVTPVAEAMVAVPLVVVPVRVMMIVPVLKLIAPIVTMPVFLTLVRAFSSSAGLTSGTVHREATHLSAVAGRYADTMEATTAARERTRATQRYFGHANDGNDHQCFCRHDPIHDDENTDNTNCCGIITALHVIAMVKSTKGRTMVKSLSPARLGYAIYPDPIE
jgi:hypothetical protein